MILAKQLGISYNSFKKYQKLAIENGLLQQCGMHLQAIKLVEVIKRLNLNIDKYNLFFRWYKYTKKPRFKDIYDQIVKSIILKNYRQQEFHILKKQNQLSILSNDCTQEGKLKVVKSLCKKGGNFEQGVTCMLEDIERGIVSGKNHVGALIGYSGTSGARWLRKLVREGNITRKIIKTFLRLPFTHCGFDTAKAQYCFGTIVPSSTLKRFILYLGSRIELTTPEPSGR